MAFRPTSRWLPRVVRGGQDRDDPFSGDILLYVNNLYGLALKLTRNPTAAEDLVQDTYLKAVRFAPGFTPGSNVKAWLFTILHNTFRNNRRGAGRDPVDVDSVRAQVARPAPRHSWLPVRLPVAATLLLTLLVFGTYTLTSTSTTVLAAQLALDHLKCVKRVQDPSGRGLDPVAAGEEWARTYKGPLTVPSAGADVGSRLVGVRRCLYGHGHLAHLLYNVNGRIVSLFVMPKADHEASEEGTLLAVFGHEARVWSAGDQTFALVSDADIVGVDRLEQTFRGE